jgi:predicted PurR-regulated permease PerM
MAPAPRWRSSDILRVTAIVVGVCLALVLLWEVQDVVFLAFMGVLFGLALSGAADLAERKLRVPRTVAAPIILILVLASIVGLTSLAAPQVASQVREVRTQVPQVVGTVRRWVKTQAGGVSKMLGDTTEKTQRTQQTQKSQSGAAGTASVEKSPAPPSATSASSVGHAFFTVFSSTLSALAGVVLIIFITLFVAVDPDLYHRGLMHLFPHRHRKRAGEVLSAMAFSMRRWLVTQLIAMIVIGLVTAGALTLLGIRGAIALGIIAGLLEFIPFVGPIASAVPAIAMGLLDSPQKALWVAVVFTLIQQSEGHLLIPLLMKDSLELPPVLTILSQAVMASVFGFLGLLVAVPVLGATMVAIKLLYVEDVVGDEVGVPGAV